MKITFLRLGHANNSSSSHSIIFTDEKLNSTERLEFGWETFTCSSKEDKASYALVTLWDSWRNECEITLGWNNAFYIDNEPIEDEIKRQFKTWVKNNFSWLVDELPDFEESEPWIGYVDHQSKLGLPKNRITGSLDVEFISELFKELVMNNYAILGGNDNVDTSHPMYDEGKNLDNDPTAMVYNYLSDRVNIQSLKDALTGEWTLSRSDGPLMKVKFN